MSGDSSWTKPAYFLNCPQIWAKIKGDLGEFDRDFRACVVLSSPGHLLRAKDRVWHHTQRHHSGRTSDKHTCAHDACARGRFTLSVRTVSIDIFQCSPAVALAKQRTSLLLILEEGERERGLDFWGNFLWREDLFVEGKLEGLGYRRIFFIEINIVRIFTENVEFGRSWKMNQGSEICEK